MSVASVAVCVAVAAGPGVGDGPPVIVGSKRFTESVILGEIVTQLAGSRGYAAEHRREIGGTRILFAALELGEIDVYPEYTGTITQEILAALSCASHSLSLFTSVLFWTFRQNSTTSFQNSSSCGRPDIFMPSAAKPVVDMVA